MVYCHDIIKRIKENLHFLSLYPPHKDNSIPLRLILRSVFSDLISLSFVVANLNNTEVISKFLNCNDYKAVSGKQTFAECEKEFLELCAKSDWSGFLEKAIIDFSNVKIDILEPFGSTGNLRNSTVGDISQVSNLAGYFKKHKELAPLYTLLFGPFKMLSQVEHYANENRSYSYFDKSTAFFFQKFAVHYQYVIPIVCEEISVHLKSPK